MSILSSLSGRRLRLAAATLALSGLSLWAALPASAVPSATTRRHEAEIRSLVRAMSLPDKVGQLFSTYAYGDTADTTDPTYVAQNQALLGVDNAAELVSKYHVGGIIYFGYANNLLNPPQIAKLSNDVQRVAVATGPKIPLLISTDQEGGNVTRIGAPVAISAGNMALGAGFDPTAAYAMSRVTGQQLKAMGINADDAPVVDTNTNPNNAADGPRAFGDRPRQVATFGAASVLGYQSAKIAATAKHFPGLGSTSVNTDFGVATSDQTRREFEANDLPAFRAAVAAGVDSIMAAHIVAPALDPTEAPASLSYPMVTGILRNELHYDGVVVTDALNAEALHDYTNAQRSVDAIKAGVDQLLIPTDLAGSIQAVLDAVQSGDISEKRIDQSVTRLLRLKQKLGILRTAQVDEAVVARRVGTPAQLTVQDRVAHRAITLLRNSAGVLPLQPDSGKTVLVTGYGVTTTTNLAAAIAGKGVTTTRVVTGTAPNEAAITAAVAAAEQADYVVDVSNNAWSDPAQRQLADRLRATGTPVVVLAVGAPYELGFAPATPTFLASYGYQPPSMRAAADVLFGAQPRGRLPITVRTPDGSAVVAKWGSGLRYR
ncbi:MAG: glycoside hydrolase family 3 N-terminal domain-containing protein [Propionibacteriaceae bacterium]